LPFGQAGVRFSTDSHHDGMIISRLRDGGFLLDHENQAALSRRISRESWSVRLKMPRVWTALAGGSQSAEARRAGNSPYLGQNVDQLFLLRF
jgi:ParB-like chromosome segregation protein Spo0J